MRSIEWQHFQWPSVTPNPSFKVTVFLEGVSHGLSAIAEFLVCLTRLFFQSLLPVRQGPHVFQRTFRYFLVARFMQVKRHFLSPKQQCQSTERILLHCALASGAVSCNRSCLCVCVCGGRAVSVTTITRNCVYRSSPNWVCRCCDHLQLIKFWRSCAPRKGVCGGGGGWLCLTTAIADSVRLWGSAAGAQCLRLSEHFFITLRAS